MLYIAIHTEDSNQLTYYCRHCGTTDETITQEGHCVLNTQLKRGEQKFNHIINKYTKLDPTLPRIHTMKCPNGSCVTNQEKKEPEVIYMRYDDSQMKYVYMCVDCDSVWTPE
jgi:hypothetical protein